MKKIISRILISAIFLSITALVQISVAEEVLNPQPAIGMYVGGSNYVMISTGSYKDSCSESEWYAGEAKPVIGYYHLYQQTVRNQLKTMYDNGQRRIVLMLWFSHFDDLPHLSGKSIWGHVLKSNGGNLIPQHQENLRNLIADIKNTGFEEIIFRYGAQGQNAPGLLPWTTWNETLYQENWNFIVNTRKIINEAWCGDATTCHGNGLKYDLGAEEGGITGQAENYTKRLWNNYVYDAGFGKEDTIGFSFALGSGTTVSRINKMLDIYDSTPGGRPSIYPFDIYEADSENEFKIIHNTLLQRGVTTEPIIILETYYNDPTQREQFKRAIDSTGRKVLFLAQWPYSRNSKCPHFSMDYPEDYSNYLSSSLGLMGYWKFDYVNSSNYTLDYSGYGNDGRLMNFNANPPTTVAGTSGRALQFDGVNDYVNIGNKANPGINDFTISVWAKVAQYNPDGWDDDIIAKTNYSSQRHGFALGVRGSLDATNANKMLFWMGLGGSSGIHLFSSSTVNDGVWHHWVAVANRTGYMKLYKDGVFDTQADISAYSGQNESSSVDLYIGGNSQSSNNNFNGTIDKVRIYNRALTTDEIKTLYQPYPNTTCPTCPSPTAWSACSNNIQTRNNYRCNASTSYLCQSYTESQSCIVTPNNTTTTCGAQGQPCCTNNQCNSGITCQNGICNIQQPNTTCPTCPSPSEWSACSNNIQTRSNYRCNATTNYLCQHYIESRSCITPTIPVNHTQNISVVSPESPVVVTIPINKSDNLKVDEVIINVNDVVSDVSITIKDTTLPEYIAIPILIETASVYKYLDITTTVPKDKMEEVIIKFKVEKSWIEENDINSSTIALNRYSDNIWTKLDTRSTNDDITYYYFESESSGFSIFAITGEKNIATIPPENKNIIWIYVVVGIGVITFLGGLFYYVNKKQERKEFDELKEKYKE